jgi:tRNA threonylcarbamoyladenosine biosynthesis protein TsaE
MQKEPGLHKLHMVTRNEQETRSVARQLAMKLMPDDVILLQGDLGAGKTTFTQGLAEGLGVLDNATSPTFTLVQEYRGGRLPLYHFDLYRLAGPEEVFNLGFFDYLEQGGVAVVEWPERLGSETPLERLVVNIQTVNEGTRTITLRGTGERYEALIRELEAA